MKSTPLREEASLALETASWVLFEVAPAMIGTRPAAASMVTSITRSHSSWVSVGVSPVVPQGRRKSMPASTCQRTSWRSAISSMLPSRLKGVTRAVPHPRSFMASNYLLPKIVWPAACANSELAKNISEIEEARLANDPFRRQHGSFRKSPSRLGLMRQNNPIPARLQFQGMNSRQIAFALRRNFWLYARCLRKNTLQRHRRSGWRVLLVDVVSLDRKSV